MLQDVGDRGRARADDRIDAERSDQRRVVGGIDQRDGALTSGPLGEQRGQDVYLVVVGSRDDGLGAAAVRIFQDARRSDEQTSELQPQIRQSTRVSCLKQK